MPISEVQHKLEILSPERKFLRAARIPRLPGVRIQRFTTALEGGFLADGRTARRMVPSPTLSTFPISAQESP